MGSSYWDALSRQRIARRRVLRATGVGAAAAAGAWAFGCTGDDENGAPSPTQGGTPRMGGTYSVAINGAFDSFDPHLAVAVAVPFFPRIYNVLVNQSATQPDYFFFDLAESYENPDELTWRFKIRPGVRVGPNELGVPERDIDAQDVVATFDRIKAEPRSPNGAFAKQFVESTTAEDDSVIVKTTQPYAWFLSRSGSFVNTIPPRELIASPASVESMLTRSAGAGPYRLTRSVEGEGATFERNPSYYRKDDANNNAQLPYIDALDVRLVADRSAMRTAFLSGQVHQYAAEDKRESDGLAGQGYMVQRDAAFNFVPVTMNAEKPPFNDPRARRAISRAINRKQIIDIVYAGDAKPNGLVHWPCGIGTYAFDEAELDELQPYDLEEARRLVDALGGLRVRFVYPSGATIAQHDRQLPIFVEQMKAAGIDLQEEPLPLPSWLDAYRNRNYEMSLGLTQVIESPELPLNWHTALGPAGDGSFGRGLNDPAIEAALLKTKTTLDTEERIAAVREAQRVIYAKDPMFLPLVCAYNYTAYNQAVRNMPEGLGTTAFLLNTMWLDA